MKMTREIHRALAADTAPPPHLRRSDAVSLRRNVASGEAAGRNLALSLSPSGFACVHVTSSMITMWHILLYLAIISQGSKLRVSIICWNMLILLSIDERQSKAALHVSDFMLMENVQRCSRSALSECGKKYIS